MYGHIFKTGHPFKLSDVSLSENFTWSLKCTKDKKGNEKKFKLFGKAVATPHCIQRVQINPWFMKKYLMYWIQCGGTEVLSNYWIFVNETS